MKIILHSDKLTKREALNGQEVGMLRVSQDKAAAIEQILAGKSVDCRLIDMNSIFENIRNKRPEICLIAVESASEKALELADYVDDLEICTVLGEDVLLEFFEPVQHLFNSTGNGIDKTQSKVYLEKIRRLCQKAADTLILAATAESNRYRYIEKYKQIIISWVAAHKREIAKYVMESRSRNNFIESEN